MGQNKIKVYSRGGEFEKAYNAYKVACKNNATVRNIVALEAERIKRILNLKEANKFRSIVKNKEVKYYQRLEVGDVDGGSENPDYMYYLLSKGKIKEGFKLAKKYDTDISYMSALVAASDNVNIALKTTILNELKIESLNLNSVWSVLGLYIKEGKNYDEMLPILQPLKFDKSRLEELILNIKAKRFSKVEKEIAEFTVKWKAQVYVLSSVILEGKIPEKWKKVIKGGLFATEKPYLNM
jgi:hypothetical protein